MAVIVKTKKLNEFKIQNILFNWTVRKKNHVLGIPNMFVWNWESDFVSVTKSNYAHEYEIKTSKADFKKDFDKRYKHNLLLESSTKQSHPSHFWYVMPDKLIDVSEIPDYAGLIYIMPYGRISIQKKAPRLWNKPATEKQIHKMWQGSMWRYWVNRQRLDEAQDKLKEGEE